MLLTDAKGQVIVTVKEAFWPTLHYPNIRSCFRDHALNYFDAESFDMSAIASCTVVINCAGR